WTRSAPAVPRRFRSTKLSKSPGPQSRSPERHRTRARVEYLARLLRVHGRRRAGPLSFWYERPEMNEAAFGRGPGYFMRFAGKARYAGPFAAEGIPLFDCP